MIHYKSLYIYIFIKRDWRYRNCTKWPEDAFFRHTAVKSSNSAAALRKHVLFSDPIFDFCQIGPQVLHGSTAAVCLQSAFGFGSRQVDLGFKDFRVCYSKITWINILEMIPLFRQPRVGSFRLFGSRSGRKFAQVTTAESNQWSAYLVERKQTRYSHNNGETRTPNFSLNENEHE